VACQPGEYSDELFARMFLRSSSVRLAVPLSGVRQHLTRILAASLLISSAFAAWMWYRPFDFSPDPAARFHIDRAALRRDQSFYWLDLHLLRNGKTAHDMDKPIRLETSTGRMIMPADVTLVSPGEAKDCDEIGLKFWLHSSDLAGSLGLHMNGGTLRVKSNPGIPSLPDAATRALSSTRW
jgi:hypothetical protein